MSESADPLPSPVLRLYDPKAGASALVIRPRGDLDDFALPQKGNTFTILWVEEGRGLAHADLRSFLFESPALLFFNPYQSFYLEGDGPLRGRVLQFHANFFCIETHHDEVGCNGILFNDLYGLPLVDPSEELEELLALHSQIEAELDQAGLARSEMLVAYLKIFLIRATRLKRRQQGESPQGASPEIPEPLAAFLELLEANYLSPMRPADYAEKLKVRLKTLTRWTKSHYGRSVGELIRERKLQHAKWHLLHSRKPVKQIAWEAGFADEYYFSRLFKRAMGLSPTQFRALETRIRQGRNLSM